MGVNVTTHEQTQNYLNYIAEHKSNVEKAWEEVKLKCTHMRFMYDDYVFNAIDSLIKRHDESKYSEHEFVQYRKYFYPTEPIELYDECEHEERFERAWKHHYKSNPHHWEFWIKAEPCDIYEEEIYAVEMVCDWMAMGYKFGDTAKDYYEKNKEKIQIPEWKREFICEIFDCVYSNK